MAALMGLFHAIWYDNSTILIISPTERQSQIVFRKMKRFLNKAARGNFAQLTNGLVRQTQHVMEWENGSMIYALPVTQEGANIRGFTADFVIIDEGAYIDDSAFSAINPMLSTTGGKMWLIGTFKGVNNEFYRTWIDGKKKNFHVYTFPSRSNPLITEDFLEDEKNRLSSLEYQQEYEARAIDEADTYFTIAEIEGCQKEYVPSPITPGNRYILGFDPARMGEDEGCALILEINRHNTTIKHPTGERQVPPFKVKRIFELRNKTINEQIGFVKKLHKEWNFDKIFVDDTGLGGGVTDDLAKDMYPVEGVVFTIKSKEELYSHCKIQMQNSMVTLPSRKQTDLDGDKLKKQLNEIKYEYQKGSGFIKLFPATKHSHDDYCFVGDTLVTTDKGQIPIRDILVGDRVLTRKGYKKVTSTGNRYAKVIKKLGLIGTPDHPIITKNGVKELTNIKAEDIIYIWNEKLSSIEEKSIIDIQTHQEDNYESITGRTPNGKRPQNHYTDKYGKTTSEKSQKGISSTTKTEIHSITNLKTLASCREENTKQNTCSQRKAEKDQGKTCSKTSSQKVKNGTGETHKHQKAEQTSLNVEEKEERCGIHQGLNTTVTNVVKNIYQPVDLEPNIAQGNVTLHMTGKQGNLKNIPRNTVKKRKVYNLSIEDEEEYFANNILVHNCSALVLALWGTKAKHAPILFSTGKATFG